MNNLEADIKQSIQLEKEKRAKEKRAKENSVTVSGTIELVVGGNKVKADSTYVNRAGFPTVKEMNEQRDQINLRNEIREHGSPMEAARHMALKAIRDKSNAEAKKAVLIIELNEVASKKGRRMDEVLDQPGGLKSLVVGLNKYQIEGIKSETHQDSAGSFFLLEDVNKLLKDFKG